LGTTLDGVFAEFSGYCNLGGIGQPVDAPDLLTDADFVDQRHDRAVVAVNFPDNQTLWRCAVRPQS
jgi:hypothetical protein